MRFQILDIETEELRNKDEKGLKLLVKELNSNTTFKYKSKIYIREIEKYGDIRINRELLRKELIYAFKDIQKIEKIQVGEII